MDTREGSPSCREQCGCVLNRKDVTKNYARAGQPPFRPSALLGPSNTFTIVYSLGFIKVQRLSEICPDLAPCRCDTAHREKGLESVENRA
jgi:hypothetical protein